MSQRPIDVQAVVFTLLAQISKTDECALTRAFEVVDDYMIYHKPKRSGGMRIIAEPHSDLKKVQHVLLLWLYRIQKRTTYYKKHEHADRGVVYREIFQHSFSPTIHGSVRGCSVKTALESLLGSNNDFIIEIDLKDAFASIQREVIEEVLKAILLTECQSYFYTYHDRLRRKKDSSPLFGTRGYFRNKIARRDMYARYPLFSSKQCLSFRKLIRDQVVNDVSFEASCLPEIVDLFTRWFTSLVTYEGSLPQGAPTSGFLLNLVLSEKYLSSVGMQGGVYVDNFLISSKKKPDEVMIEQLIAIIEKGGIVKVNRAKVKVFDLRNQSAPLLGMKVVKRVATESECKDLLRRDRPKGLKHHMTEKKSWTITHIALSKQKQKQYRGFLHRCITQPACPESIAKAHGYVGHIVSAYGWATSVMPSSLRTVVQLFRLKFVTPISP